MDRLRHATGVAQASSGARVTCGFFAEKADKSANLWGETSLSPWFRYRIAMRNRLSFNDLRVSRQKLASRFR